MIYADYEYYSQEFHGDRIPEDKFPAAARDASREIDYVTFGRLEAADDIPDKVKEACCAAAEVLYLTEDAALKAAGGISSEKVGELSVTYSAGGTSGSAGGAVRDVIKKYLGNTGLMYRGQRYDN